MKKLILLAFMLMANVFAGEAQEAFCDDKSLSYCINHFDRQCDAKNYGACFIVGWLHKEQEQYGKAKKYYELVCDKANSKDSYELEWIDDEVSEIPAILSMQDSCGTLSILYYNGQGVRQSYEKALHYKKKACDLGEGDSCAAVGNMYFFGEGVQKDLSRARKFFAKSCELESGVGCAVLGLSYEYGDKGVKQNYSKAKELYGKACDLGEQKGCDSYKKLKERGY